MSELFPFPNKMEARNELLADIHINKIPAELQEAISDKAWLTGAKAAEEIKHRYPGMTIETILKKEGLKVTVLPKDNVTAGVRYFSEYYSGRREIILYKQAVKLWAKNNDVTYEQAKSMILAHEFYHHLECTKLGLTSKQYQVPKLQVGKFAWGKTGIKSLSEIGAHGFAYGFYNKAA